MTPALLSARRHFFHQCRLGLGTMALGSLLAEDGVTSAERSATAGVPAAANEPLIAKQPHFAPRAKSVIFLFMAGGPSQLELFDPKPKLQELDGQQIPESFVANKRFAFIKQDAKLQGTKRKFARHGASGQVISECLPHLAGIADEICTLRAMNCLLYTSDAADE